MAPLLWCPTAMFMQQLQCQCNRALTCAGDKGTNNRSSCEQSSFMQSARHSLAGHGPSCSSRELRRQLVLDLLVSSGVWHIATGPLHDGSLLESGLQHGSSSSEADSLAPGQSELISV
ncbi:hypothetical protein AVEN_12506-1 [Araneus ventricosus]|uniref:Uncharacterized protein n=1 Tax=Araneus ventricosus TaxID=182803 RepID=A0A4Y2LDP4_ARAVE|nr:hypothetical protein AVEN_12506-1 [Araneus ventricosus]